LQRVAFQLRIRPGKEEEYEEAHRHVWPELLQELERFEVSDYSIFRRGQQLFLYLHVPDFDQLLKHLAASDVNERWQREMAPLFEPVPDRAANEPVARMQEVFFMPGNRSPSSSSPSDKGIPE
jgi:L-rhamnose mutarotase